MMTTIRMHRIPRYGQQRGAATMIVVMVLFFIMAMMAAFANRNLMFEQRIAGNYYRAGVSAEAAEAGVEWALAMLNGANVNNACLATGAATQSFRNRYLSINRDSRLIAANDSLEAVSSACVHNAVSGWVCQCPAFAAWVQADNSAPDQNRLQPSFTVTFKNAILAPNTPPFTISPGVIKLVSNGCSTSLPSDCTNIVTGMAGSLGLTQVTVTAALVSALKMPPATPLTVKGTVAMDATGLGLHNTDPRSSGLLMVAGGAPATGWIDARLDSLPGTPPRQALIEADLALNAATATVMFQKFFGMSPTRYSEQPAVRQITCATDCMTSLITAYGQGVRIAWIGGNMTVSSNQILGTATDPMIVIATGNVLIQGAMQLTGLLYARGNVDWNSGSGLSMVTGALITEGNFVAAGAVDIWYQAAVMDELKNRSGSFVRVPGSWWDQP